MTIMPIMDKELKELLPVSLSNTSQSKKAMDEYITRQRAELTCDGIRQMINRIFSINLDGISRLEGQRISLYSKRQWVLRQACDLLIVYTGTDDRDVKVIPTKYFSEHTGSDRLPEDLQKALSNLGYRYDEKIGAYYFIATGDDQAVPDTFKGQTLSAVLEAINKLHLDI
ncbi:hypothetical protein [Planococcus lenghuensis]|uniref:hypothetical protein n=1 Tax=Planococcus lenghuensis TaxID=2213202 RepID=UPI0012EB99F6|nr:hypothetical protein [Planococcus lenghuensis]